MKRSLGESLTIQGAALSLPKAWPMPSEAGRLTRKALLKLEGFLDKGESRPTENRLAEAHRKLLAAQLDDSYSSLGFKIVKDSVWFLWPEQRDGLDRHWLLGNVLGAAKQRDSVLRRLIDVWIYQFDPKNLSFSYTGAEIRRLLVNRQSMKLSAWRAVDSAYALFDSLKGPNTIAKAIASSTDSSPLVEAKLTNPMRASSSYLRAVHFEFSNELPAIISKRGGDGVERAFSFYCPGGKLRFDEVELNGMMADAFIAPWLNGGRAPAKELQDIIADFLVRFLGDPRVSPQRWSRTTDATKKTIRAWLSRISLNAFFHTIGQFANKAGMDHHWSTREAFWKACLDKEFISDSWLILGRNVYQYFKSKKELVGIFGQLVDSDANHSVLVIRIGNLVFAEWSHNGKLRVWDSATPEAQKLLNLTDHIFYRRELITPSLVFPPPSGRPDLGSTGTEGLTHHPDIWQGRVAALLAKKQRLIIGPNDWRLR